MKEIVLRPIWEHTGDWDELELRLKRLFRDHLYLPLIKELQEPRTALENAKNSPLVDALRSGRITFSQGTFSGKLSAAITKDLRDMGATWDRKSASFKAQKARLPKSVQAAISSSDSYFQEKIQKIDARIAKILPANFADLVQASDVFSENIKKTENKFAKSVERITVAPRLTEEARKIVADEYEFNLQKWVKDFTKKETLALRQQVKKAYFAGNRREKLIKVIQKSYGVSQNKATFLARQETSNLMSTFKEAKYKSIGCHEYYWDCVAGSKNHPVRPQHKKLADASKRGKTYRWDDPPITTEPGQPVRRNNPGKDFGCRCSARAVVRF